MKERDSGKGGAAAAGDFGTVCVFAVLRGSQRVTINTLSSHSVRVSTRPRNNSVNHRALLDIPIS